MRRGHKKHKMEPAPSREALEAELPQAPPYETIPEPQPIGGERGPRPQIERRED